MTPSDPWHLLVPGTPIAINIHDKVEATMCRDAMLMVYRCAVGLAYSEHSCFSSAIRLINSVVDSAGETRKRCTPHEDVDEEKAEWRRRRRSRR